MNKRSSDACARMKKIASRRWIEPLDASRLLEGMRIYLDLKPQLLSSVWIKSSIAQRDGGGRLGCVFDFVTGAVFDARRDFGIWLPHLSLS